MAPFHEGREALCLGASFPFGAERRRADYVFPWWRNPQRIGEFWKNPQIPRIPREFLRERPSRSLVGRANIGTTPRHPPTRMNWWAIRTGEKPDRTLGGKAAPSEWLLQIGFQLPA
jgi:hypothetical protein